MSASLNIEKVVQAYNAIRDARTVRRHAYEAEDVKLEADQQLLKGVLLQLLNQSGARSMTTDAGTVFKSEKIKPSAADWGVIWDWMKEHDAPDLVERRLKTTFIKDYMEANAGALPPGVNVMREFEVTVRRPTKAKDGDNEQEA